MTSIILQKYIEMMQDLNLGEKSDEGGAPHQPILMLSVIDLFVQGEIMENKIYYSKKLKNTMKEYWSFFPDRRFNIIMPFFHLQGGDFWHLQAKPEKEKELQSTLRIRSISELQEKVEYAYFDEDLFFLLQDSNDREIIRQTIINYYFADLKDKIENLNKKF